MCHIGHNDRLDIKNLRYKLYKIILCNFRLRYRRGLGRLRGKVPAGPEPLSRHTGTKTGSRTFAVRTRIALWGT